MRLGSGRERFGSLFLRSLWRCLQDSELRETSIRRGEGLRSGVPECFICPLTRSKNKFDKSTWVPSDHRTSGSSVSVVKRYRVFYVKTLHFSLRNSNEDAVEGPVPFQSFRFKTLTTLLSIFLVSSLLVVYRYTFMDTCAYTRVGPNMGKSTGHHQGEGSLWCWRSISSGSFPYRLSVIKKKMVTCLPSWVRFLHFTQRTLERTIVRWSRFVEGRGTCTEDGDGWRRRMFRFHVVDRRSEILVSWLNVGRIKSKGMP